MKWKQNYNTYEDDNPLDTYPFSLSGSILLFWVP